MAFAGPNPLAALIAARAGGGAPQPDAQDSGPDKASDIVSQMIDLGQRAVAAEKDPVEREGLAKIVALLHGFAAREQKQRDAAMGAGPAVQMLRRQQG